MLQTSITRCMLLFILLTGCRTTTPSSQTSGAAQTANGSGTLIVVSGQVHVFQDGAWTHPFGKEMYLSDLQFFRSSRDTFFVNVNDPEGARNLTHGWRFWNIHSNKISQLVTGSRTYRPYRFLASGALVLKNEHFKYTEVILQDTEGRRVEHARSGKFLYNYVDSGIYSYIDWPSIGEEESKLYSNLVAGKQMLLKMGDQSRRETVLAAATAILQPRFVDGGKGVCYFKPGQYLPKSAEKTFMLECVSSAGVVRPFGTIRAHEKGSRLPPVIWAFEDSPYVVTYRLTPSHPQYQQTGPIEVFNAQSDEKPQRYTLGAGWMLVPQISQRGAGIELEPYVVAVSRTANKLRVLKLPSLEAVLETTLPANLDRNVLKAGYIPASTSR